ncbi:uncharacterized protein K452DRAFT_315272 [Aplosporella prunicola CBS 121167]|uniref:DNA endonuclease activator Ctp1 C-terminal domain-containing protein n=1 Tax=Aplosporella prunicola CBS 121167 TaxID=1176127 RepID=A0A6A6BPK6_9PEZI|nr:uncharacterized protein K452DRAFT_315272 [Aplosporella prunicola CBS 121167]KAF2146006.1 hypothetical protein K452DRAFT_315272 [Aplosporella prunicola CBS 121167]
MGEKGWQEEDLLKQGADDPLEALLLRGDQYQHEIRVILNQHRKTIANLAIEANKVGELEKENKLLRSQLEAKLEQTSSSTMQTVPEVKDSSEQEFQSSSTVSTQPLTVPYVDYKALVEKYNTLSIELKASREAFDLMYTKCKDAKKNVRRWDIYLKRHNLYDLEKRRHMAPDAPPPLPQALLDSDTPRPDHFLDRTTAIVQPEKAELPGMVEEEMPSSPPGKPLSFRQTEHDQTEVNDFARVGQVAEELPSRISSSQTTQDDGPSQIENPQPAAKPQNDDNDDTPVVISARSLGRKPHSAAGKDTFAVYEDARVKQEPCSSPRTQRPLTRKDTLDLDDMGAEIDTPRKRRRFEMYRNSQIRLSQIPPLNHEKSQSFPVGFENIQETGNDEGQQLEGGNASPEVTDSDPIIEEIERTDTATTSKRKRSIIQRSPENPRKAQILHTLSTNAKVASSNTGSRSRRRKRHSEEDRGAKHINLLAEDGEGSSKSGPGSPALTMESRRRLQNLLDAPTPEKPDNLPVLAPTTPVTSKSLRTFNKNAERPSDETPVARPKSSTRSKASKTPDQLPTPQSAPQTAFKRPRLEAGTASRARSPLRSRPLERLSLSDFKVNPRSNQGINEVFNEVVRNREARRCLPGCTDPTCCGKYFRALVEGGMEPTVPRSLFEESQGETDEDRLLRYFLGNGYNKERVAVMPDVQRQELLLDAKTKLLADQHGRHRQAYERQKSPPGFWRTDMPSTQEIEKDREEARKLERKAVEDRWREAMKGNGQWLFKDE